MNYLEIIKNVLNNGTPKQATRYDAHGNVLPVENGTIGTFCEIFRHDMSKGFPLTTLRKMPWQSVRVELEGFIKGVTSKAWYQERKCKFWDEWCNPHYLKNVVLQPPGSYTKEYIKKTQAKVDDLGPVYGAQWRNFGKHYKEECQDHGLNMIYFPSGERGNGLVNGFDQLGSIVEKLKTSPYDRRMICSAWNPNQEHLMALPPCHYSWGVVVYGNKLNLHWNQRSVDSSHGLPNNIASYALLQLLLCEESGLEPGELVGKLEDCHLYENTLPAVKELIKREEKELPQVKIKRKSDESFSIFDWTYDEVELIGYNPHSKLDMGSVTV